MPKPERQQQVLELLKELRGIEPLKQLFWSELSYQRVNEPLSRRGWTESAAQALADDPVLFAGGGENNDFHVLHCRLASDRLLLGAERPVVSRLVREHPYALFVFSNNRQDRWHFLNVKYDKAVERRQLFRRITVVPGDGLRTASERLALLNLEDIGADRSPLTIQEHHDAAFDVEKVTKDFYAEIANWYFWACDHVEFPMPKGTANPDAYKAQSLIRLVTRLIFCWFVKEKGLIPGELFDSRALAELLKEGADLPGSEETTYYKAILQNLFFATLNQEMDKRGFRKRNKDPQGRDPHRGITNLYRYEDCFADPKAFLRLAAGIPFLNGGLFECLDKVYRAEEKLPDVRIDGFSDHPKNPLSVPDFLFFGEERTVDLSAAYGEKRYRQATVRGLIQTFGRYKFTITENTPLDQEVALDPELSGKVFENLLAAYNPETATTARKQTGSFYTPREIVDYMVDEALMAYLATKLNHGDTEDTEKKLRHLFAYTDEPHQFGKAEAQTLIAAIDNLKALDPACGSGAFPMGLLHKLVFILGKLDPHNEQWKQKQIAKASEIPDATVREKTLADIEQAFAANELDYGRKLYLIENCIYGVDIQPIAVQIAKMRFFISLIVEQAPTKQTSDFRLQTSDFNLGIRPLPNLETKFVAANTLIGIEKPAQQMLRNPQIDAKEAELRQVRERHFTARTPATKARCREQDAKLRAEIGELLRADGFARETTEKLANWNPYDQNASADFFDPEWMFGITGGFHIVMGNPPFGAEVPPELVSLLRAKYESVANSFDSFIMFIERAADILGPAGALAYIVPSGWVSTPSSRKLRALFVRTFKPLVFASLPYDSFASAYVDTMVVISQRLCKGDSWFSLPDKSVRLVVFPIRHPISSTGDFQSFEKPGNFGLWPNPVESGFLVLASRTEADLVAKLTRSPKCFADYVDVMRGIETYHPGPRNAFRSPRPALTGDIHRYSLVHGPPGYIDYPKEIEASKPWAFFGGPRILLRQLISRKFRLQAVVTEQPFLTNQSVQSLIAKDGDGSRLKLLLGILNSRLVSWFFCQMNMVARRDDFPKIIIKQTRELPVPELDLDAARRIGAEICALVDRILAAKRADAAADTSGWEREIDERVYRLYGLTKAEIKVVEGGK